MMRSNQHRCTSSRHFSHQGRGGCSSSFVEGRHRFVQDEQTLTATDQAWQQGTEHAHFPSLTLRKREHPVVEAMSEIHALSQLGQYLVVDTNSGGHGANLEMVPNALVADASIGLEQHAKGKMRVPCAASFCVPDNLRLRLDDPFLERMQAQNCLDEGGLPGSVFSQKEGARSRFKRKGPAPRRTVCCPRRTTSPRASSTVPMPWPTDPHPRRRRPAKRQSRGHARRAMATVPFAWPMLTLLEQAFIVGWLLAVVCPSHTPSVRGHPCPWASCWRCFLVR